MSKPASYFPTTDVPSYQELGTDNDTNGTFTQIADVVINAGYAASGAISITAAGTPFSAWPTYGFIQNLSSNEILFFDSITGSNTLVILAVGRGRGGSVAAAGLNGQTIRFIEARILGGVMNQILAEITALNKIKTINASTGTTNLTTAQSHQSFTSSGAAIFNLPAAAINLKYTFYNVVGGITINCVGTDVIYEGVVPSAAAGNIVGNDVIGVLELTCVAAGKWAVTKKIGTWSVT